MNPDFNFPSMMPLRRSSGGGFNLLGFLTFTIRAVAKVVFVLALVTGIPVTANAGGRVRGPGYSYGHNNYVDYQKVLVLHQVAPGIREEAIAKKAATEALALRDAQHAKDMAAMRQQLQQQFSAALSGKICLEIGGKAASAGSTAANHPASPDPSAASNALDAAAQAVVNKSCTRCHNATKADGGLDLSDVSRLDALMRHKVEFSARTGIMPKNGPAIGDEDAAILQQWIIGK